MVLAFALMLLSGCSGITPENRNDKITVAASFYPVYIFTLNLLNEIDEVDVQCMAEQSVGCLHDYTLTAKDAKLLSDARVLVINGGGMESFLDDAPRSVGSFNVIDSSVGIVSVCHDDHHEHEDHPHENSHIWLSPDKAKKQIYKRHGSLSCFRDIKLMILWAEICGTALFCLFIKFHLSFAFFIILT